MGHNLDPLAQLADATVHPATTADPMASAAIGYGVRGFEVFPARGKVPAEPGEGGYRKATANPTILQAWWTRWPGANIGLRPSPGIVAIDVDARDNGGQNLLQLLDGRRLPPTLTCNTGSRDPAGSLHAYYHMGLDAARRDVCPGVQLKAHATGYLIAPPSRHPDSGKRYLWANQLPIATAPDWLIDLCRKPEAETLPRPTSWRPPSAAGQQRRLEALLDFVLASTVGERNSRLYWAACRAGEHVTGGRVAADDVVACLVAAATAVGLTDRAARATINSAMRTVAAA